MEGIGSTRTIELTKLALDGLSERQKAISANTANVMTPGYQRKEVVFEDQLRDILDKENYKRDIKRANSAALSYNATELDIIKKPTSQQLSVLNKDVRKSYQPEVLRETMKYNPELDNNVDIEKEMMSMAKTGMQYNILANMEANMLSGLSEVIRGGNG